MKYDKVVGMAAMHIDTKRIDNNLKSAQDISDQQVLNDMIPYMPFQQGAMVGATQIIEPGIISTNTPYAHYQYMGELYLAENGSSWAHKGEAKYPTDGLLQYSKAGAVDHWFEHAKQEHGEQWIELVKREVGKG